MPFAALILAQTDGESGAATQPLLLTLGGQTLLERMVDQAIRLGCQHVIICAGPLPSALMGALDRLKARGVDLALARTPREAADQLHPEEQVLLFNAALILPDEELSGVAALTQPTLFTLPEIWGRDRYERIDAQHNWAGIAVLPASLIRETVAMLGDWAFGPTLLRRAVQLGATRRAMTILSEADGDAMAPVLREDLAGAALAIIRTAEVQTDGVGEKALLPPLRQLASRLVLKPISASMIACLALLMGWGSLVSAGFGLMSLGMGLLILGYGLALLTHLVGQAGLAERAMLGRLLQGRALWLPLAVFVYALRLAVMPDAHMVHALLALWLAVQMLVLVHAHRNGAALPSWRIGDVGTALFIGIACLTPWPWVGFGLSLGLALVVQLAIQMRDRGGQSAAAD